MGTARDIVEVWKLGVRKGEDEEMQFVTEARGNNTRDGNPITSVCNTSGEPSNCCQTIEW